ncbi:MAG TPA: DMT family transporter [Candidatus Acidoferrales bacterium]|nr:DMT family transporter [Candidatus Acidoferrales bacterium]
MSTRIKADLALAMCALVWGATFVLVKNALADASVFAFLAARFVISTALVGLIFRRSLKRATRAEVRAGLWIGIFMFGGYAFQTVGLVSTTPSKAAFITGSSVVLVPIFHGIFWKSRIGLWVWLGAVAALAGLYFLTVPRTGLTGLNHGDLIVGGCAVVFALHILFVGHFSPKHSVGSLSFYQIAMTAALSLLAMPVSSILHLEPVRFRPSPELLLAILICAVFATAFAFSIQIWAQQHTTPSHVAILFSLEPVFAAATSYLVLGERLSGRALAGAALILAGIVLAELLGPAPVAVESTGEV